MYNIWKRSLAMLLAILMVVGQVPVSAFATEEIVEEVVEEVIEEVYEEEVYEEEIVEEVVEEVIEEEVTEEITEEVAEAVIEEATEAAAEEVIDFSATDKVANAEATPKEEEIAPVVEDGVKVAYIGEAGFETVQAAINAANDGDIVTIGAGEFAPINISNKNNITIEGTKDENGELLTIIKGGNPAITGHGFNGIIKDLKIVDAWKVMYAEPAGNVTVDNVYVTGATYGFHLVAYSAGLTWTIQNSYMDLSWANSFGKDGAGDAKIVITGNEFVSKTPYYPEAGANHVNSFLPDVTITENIFGKNAKILIRPAVTDTSKVIIAENYHADIDNAFADGGADVKIESYYAAAEDVGDTQKLIVMPKGTVTYGFVGQDSIWGEATSNTKKSLVVKLYEGETEIATATLSEQHFGKQPDGSTYVTWSIPFVPYENDSWSWTWAEGYPSCDMAPTAVKLYSDGVHVATNEVQFNGPDNINKIVAMAADKDGKVLGAYTSLADLPETASTVVLKGDSTGDVIMPAGATLIGNGYAINGTLTAGGDLTFVGHTKATAFSAGYYNRTITIGEGACLEITGTGRVTLGYGNTFNVTGSIADAKTADKANVQPSLIIPGGMSITGGNDAAMNVTNAYVSIGSTSSKNNAANGIFDLKFTNSIVDFTDQFTLAEPTGGKNPTFRVSFENSVVTTATKLCVAASNSTVDVKNSTVTLGTYLRNSGKLNLTEGSVLTGSMIQFGENGGNDGTITVDASTLTIKNSSAGHAMDGNGTGKVIVANGGSAEFDHVIETAVTVDTESSLNVTGSIKTGTITVDAEKYDGKSEVKINLGTATDMTVNTVNSDDVKAKLDANGKFVLAGPTATIGDKNYFDLQTAVNAAEEEDMIVMANDEILTAPVVIGEDKWFTLDLNGKSITAEGITAFQVAGDMTIKGNGTVTAATIAENNGWLTVENGTYEGTAALFTGTGKTYLTGGNFTGDVGTVEAAGGTYDRVVADENLADDYGCVERDGKFVVEKVKAVATIMRGKITTHYATLAEAIAAAKNSGDTITMNGHHYVGKLNVAKNVTIDLNGYTLHMTQGDSKFSGNVTIENGTIDITGLNVSADAIFNIYGDMTLNNVNVIGDGYGSAFAVFYVRGENALEINDSSIVLANDTSSSGGVFKAELNSVGKFTINNTVVELENVVRGAVNADLVLNGAELTITGGDNGINGGKLTATNSEITITGGTGRGLTIADANASLTGTTMTLSDNGEGDILFKNELALSYDNTSVVNAAEVRSNVKNAKINDEVVTATSAEPGSIVDSDYTNPDWNVQLGEDDFFMTLQEAVNAAAAGDNEIVLLKDYTEDVTISQVEGINIIIDGDGNEYSGTIHLDGNSRHTGTETLTIQNINFITEETDHDFIELDSAAEAVRYAHNVTVKDSTFTAPEGANSVVGMRYRQCYNMVVENVEANNLFLLMWTDGGNNLTVSGAEINTGSNTIAEGGFSVGTEKNISITGAEISGGLYGVRLDADNADTSATIGGTIDSTIPVLVRYAKADYAVNVADGTVLKGTQGYQVAVVGGNASELAHINKDNAVAIIPEIEGVAEADVFIAKPVICIDRQGYATLQDAVDAAEAMGGAIIELNGAVTGNAIVEQAPNVKITINGNGNTLNGTITVDGKSAAYATAALEINNVVFKAESISADAYINLGKEGDNNTRYASNVTVNGCTFEGNEGIVGIKSYTGGSKNLTVNGCTATGLHSLIQGAGIANVKVENTEIENCKSGISLSGSSTNPVITGTTINTYGDDGYGIRVEGGAETVTVKDTDITAALPILARKLTATKVVDGVEVDDWSKTITINTDDETTLNPTNDNLNTYGIVAVGNDVDKNNGLDAAAASKYSVVVNNKKITEVDENGDVYVALCPVYIGTVGYATLSEALKAVQDGNTVQLRKNIEITEAWDCRNNGAKITADNVTIDGNGHTLIFTGEIKDNNWNTVFRFEGDNAKVQNLTIDVRNATGAQRIISSKLSITVDNCNFIGNGTKYGVIVGEGAGDQIGNVTATVKDSTFENLGRGVRDNDNGQNVKSFTVTGNTFVNAKVALSASEKVTFTGNITNSDVTITSYASKNELAVVATGNTLNPEAINTVTANPDADTTIVQEGFKLPVATDGSKFYLTLAAAKGKSIQLLTDVAESGDLTDTTIDLNGKILTGDVKAKLVMNGGTYKTTQYTMVAPSGALYESTDAVITISGATLDTTLHSGTMTVVGKNNEWYTMEGQTLTIEGGKFVIPENVTLCHRGYAYVKGGELTVDGTIKLIDLKATIKSTDANLNVISGVDGMGVIYENGFYKIADFVVAIGNTPYTSFSEALKYVQDGQTITLMDGISGKDPVEEMDFDKNITFTVKGKAPDYQLPVVTFQNATVNIKDAEILIPELDARQNATINVIDSIVHGDGDDEIVKSYYNGAINVSGKSVIHTMQVTTMGYITISGEAVVNATTGINVFGNGLITVKDKAVLNAASLQLTAKDYSGRDNTDADRVGKPAQITVDGATFVVGKVYSEGGSDYSYNSKYGINVGTIAGKSAILDIKNGATVEIYMAKGETTKVGADGTVNVADSTFTVANRSADGTVTLENKGAVNVYGESTLNIATLTGENIDLMDGAIVKDSTIGGEVFVAGKVIFRGDNTVNMLYDYGTLTDYYGTTANMEWTVEEGASLTVINEARYGLGYGDSITIVGQLENGEALTGREGLENIKKSFFAHGLVAQESKGWNCKSSMIVKNAFVEIGSNNSFGNKPGNYGGEYTISFENAIVNSSRITFYEALSTTNFTMNGTDALVGTFMTRDKDSTFTLTNSKLVSTTATNGNDEGNYHAGTLTLIDSDLTYSASLVVEGGTISIDAASKLTAPSIEGNGKLIIDATGMKAGPLVTVAANTTKFTGEIEVINNPYLFAVNENGSIKLVGYEANIGDTFYVTLAEAFAEAKNGDEVFINVPGTYALTTSGKDITITGAVDGVVFDNIGAKNMGGANVTFNNVTFDYYPNVNYTGLQHSGNLVYNDCTINGQVFLYGASETFNGCTFNQDSKDAYNVWTYGAEEVAFNECTFNSAGKSVLIYAESAAITNDVTVNNSTFNASAPVDGKAAIEMDSSLTNGIKLNITKSTATGFGTGSISGNSLWNNKMDNNKDVNNDITVKVDNNVVLAPVVFVAYIGEIGYTTLDAANEAAQTGETIKLAQDLTLSEIFVIDKAITLDGNGKTLTSTAKRAINVNCADEVTIKNLTVATTSNTERAINVIQKAAKLTLDNVKAEGFKYTINVAESSNGSEITINGGKFSGYAALNLYGNNTTVTVNDSQLTGHNIYEDNGSNSYATIMVVGNNTSVTVNGGSVTASSADGCDDQWIIGTDANTTGMTAVLDTELTGVIAACNLDGNTLSVRADYADELAAQNLTTSEPDANDMITVTGTAVAKIGNVAYLTIDAAIKAAQPGDTVTILAGEYTQNVKINKDITVVGETDAEGNNLVSINGYVSMTGQDVHLKNVNVTNNDTAWTSFKEIAALSITGSGSVENCNLTGYHSGIREGHANGTVEIINCNVTGTTLYGIHFDKGIKDDTVKIIGGTVTGWTSFASTVENVVIDGTTFADGTYDQLRFFQNAELNNVTFNENMTVDFGKNEVTAEFNGCTVENGETLKNVIYINDIGTMGINVYVDDVKWEVAASVTDTNGETNYYLTLDEALVDWSDGETLTLLKNVTGGTINMPANATLNGKGKVVMADSAVYVDPAGGTIQSIQFKNITNDAKQQSAIYAVKLAGTLTINSNSFENIDWDAIQITPVEDAKINITHNTFRGEAKRYVHIQSEKNVDFAATITNNKMCNPATTCPLDVYYFTDPGKINITRNHIENPDMICILKGDGENMAEMALPLFAEDMKTEIKYAALIKGQYEAQFFTELAKAADAAKAGETIFMLNDVADAGKINLKAGVTLEGNNNTISGNTAIYMNAGATVNGVNFQNISNGNNLSAIYATDPTGKIIITNNTFDTVDWDAIQISTGKTYSGTVEAVIRDNTFSGKAKRYIHVEGYGYENENYNLTITDNTLNAGATEDAIGLYYLNLTEASKLFGNTVAEINKIRLVEGAWVKDDFSGNEFAVEKFFPVIGNNTEYVAYIYTDDADGYFATGVSEVENGKTVRLLADPADKIGADVTLILNSHMVECKEGWEKILVKDDIYIVRKHANIGSFERIEAWTTGTEAGGDYREAVMFTMKNVVARNSVKVELYSNGTKIATSSLQKGLPIIGGGLSVNTVVYGKASSSWKTEWLVDPITVDHLPDQIKIIIDDEHEQIINGIEEELFQKNFYEFVGVYKEATVTDSNNKVTYYADLADAVAAAKTGDVVDLRTDVELSEILVINTGITFNGNGKKLISTADRAINIDTEEAVAINNLTIEGAANTERAVNVINKAANLTLDTITAENFKYTVNVAFEDSKAAVTVKNSNISGYVALNVWGDANVGVENSNLTGINKYPNADANSCAAIMVYNGATVNVTGGSVTAESLDGCAAQTILGNNLGGKDMKVTLDTVLNLVGENTGYIGIDLDQDYEVAVRAVYEEALEAEGLAVVAAGTDMVKVTGIGIAEVNGKLYATLDEASVAGGEIKLVMDITTAQTISATSTLDMNGKTVSGNITAADGATLTVKNGTVTGDITGNMVIVDGTITGTVSGTAVVTGGNLVGATIAENTKLTVSGGFFGIQLKAEQCAEGYVPTVTENGYTVIKTDDAAAKIGENYFATVFSAAKHATAGQTIELLKAATANGVVIDKALTLDLKGYELTVAMNAIEVNAALNLISTDADGKEAELKVTSAAETAAVDYLFHVGENGELNIARGTFTGKGIANGNGGKTTVTGGIFPCASSPFTGNGIVVSGGIFLTAPRTQYLANGYSTVQITDKTHTYWMWHELMLDQIIRVDNNSYADWDQAKTHIESENETVKEIFQLADLRDIELTIPEGATYDGDYNDIAGNSVITLSKDATIKNVNLVAPAKIVAAAGYTLVKNEDGSYTVKDAKAKIDETYYESLAEALNDAKKAAEPATIILLADDTVEQIVDFVVTIEKNGHTANIKADTEKGYKLVESAEKYEVVEESAKLFEIDFVSMVLQNSLMMRFAFPADSAADWTGAYAVATKTYADGSANVEQIVPFAEWLTADINGVKHYHFAFDKIAGKEMTDNIYVVVYNAAGEAISEEYVESVRSYVMRTLNNPANSSNRELLTMMVDMLNYGAAAQESFNYAKNDLANNELTQEQKAMGSAVLAPCADNRIKGENYQGSRLMLEESIKFQMGFAGLTEEMYAEIKFTDHYGKAQSYTVKPEKMEASGTVVIEINQIVVADARSLVSVTVYNSDGTVYGSATDSVESYVARMTNSNDPLYEMIMKFADSAYAYMH